MKDIEKIIEDIMEEKPQLPNCKECCCFLANCNLHSQLVNKCMSQFQIEVEIWQSRLDYWRAKLND